MPKAEEEIVVQVWLQGTAGQQYEEISVSLDELEEYVEPEPATTAEFSRPPDRSRPGVEMRVYGAYGEVRLSRRKRP